MRFTGETVPAGVRGCARARSHVGEDPTVAPAILPARRPYEVDDYTRIPLQRGGTPRYTCLLPTKAPVQAPEPGRGYIVDDMSSTAGTDQQSSATPAPEIIGL
jgi:hypothetical protein